MRDNILSKLLAVEGKEGGRKLAVTVSCGFGTQPKGRASLEAGLGCINRPVLLNQECINGLSSKLDLLCPI